MRLMSQTSAHLCLTVLLPHNLELPAVTLPDNAGYLYLHPPPSLPIFISFSASSAWCSSDPVSSSMPLVSKLSCLINIIIGTEYANAVAVTDLLFA
ncbi:hypothetical protein BaRGS_00033891 [Batillaria attramentaria]|uniref:Uncharacterized protein n=1 Tax=Batillaria attramentaria TaxID=370345 RepID=A0ABD0JIN6_9CAEN